MKWMTKTSMILALAFVLSAGHVMVLPVNANSAQDSIKTSPGKIAVIKSISVTGEGDATELVIKLSSPATYTSYKTTAPLRLVLDLSQASEGVITAPLVFNKGNFKTITANRFDTDAGVLTRIDIELNKEAEAVITASPTNPGELRVSFPSLEPVKQVVDKKVNSIDSSIKSVTPVRKTTEIQPVADPTVKSVNGKSRKLTTVLVDNNTIVLNVEGGVGEFSTFRLNKPERYVIDLFDTQLSMTSRIVPLNAAGVSSARIGMYPDKLRVVLDSVNENLPEITSLKSNHVGLMCASESAQST